ncbi:hypothetical protein SAMN04488501_103179 [Clostridium homopropionicum]|nr:hypothetical protein SAMN04488501_103179 [Clostridium homopropionicum]
METKVDNLDTRIDNLETKVDNNTILLEKAHSDIKLLAEGHENLVRAIEKQGEKIMEVIDKNYSLHDIAIKELSRDINKGKEAYTYIQSIKDVLTNKG